jgi:hypothetical protein
MGSDQVRSPWHSESKPGNNFVLEKPKRFKRILVGQGSNAYAKLSGAARDKANSL